MRKFYPILLFVVVAITTVACRRPPWFKPCWAFLCNFDPIDPVCTWDPEHGARMFKNECCMKRHNYCYTRNYAIVKKYIGFRNSVRLCSILGNLTEPNHQNVRAFHH